MIIAPCFAICLIQMVTDGIRQMILTHLLTHSHTPNLEMLSHLKRIYVIRSGSIFFQCLKCLWRRYAYQLKIYFWAPEMTFQLKLKADIYFPKTFCLDYHKLLVTCQFCNICLPMPPLWMLEPSLVEVRPYLMDHW